MMSMVPRRSICSEVAVPEEERRRDERKEDGQLRLRVEHPLRKAAKMEKKKLRTHEHSSDYSNFDPADDLLVLLPIHP